MKVHFRLPPFLLFTVAALLFSCSSSHHSAKEVEAAMQQYNHLIKKLDADSIALLFTADGDLGGIAQGRDSIKKFLSGFKNIEVIQQTSSTDSLQINGNSTVQKGSYRQTDVVAQKDTVHVKGFYTANWVWLKSGGWHLQKMMTKPAN